MSVLELQTVRLADFMLKKTMKYSGAVDKDDFRSSAGLPVAVTPPRPLDLALSPASMRNIAAAEVAFDELVDSHEVRKAWASTIWERGQ